MIHIHNNTNDMLIRKLTVGEADINDEGQLNTCTMLSEILGMNDHIIAHTYGSLSYDTITAWQYDLSITGEAVLDDELVIESAYNLTAAGLLQVRMFVKRVAGDLKEIIARGNFTFSNTRPGRHYMN